MARMPRLPVEVTAVLKADWPASASLAARLPVWVSQVAAPSSVSVPVAVPVMTATSSWPWTVRVTVVVLPSTVLARKVSVRVSPVFRAWTLAALLLSV